jgi:hypothetical protein
MFCCSTEGPHILPGHRKKLLLVVGRQLKSRTRTQNTSTTQSPAEKRVQDAPRVMSPQTLAHILTRLSGQAHEPVPIATPATFMMVPTKSPRKPVAKHASDDTNMVDVVNSSESYVQARTTLGGTGLDLLISAVSDSSGDSHSTREDELDNDEYAGPGKRRGEPSSESSSAKRRFSNAGPDSAILQRQLALQVNQTNAIR